MMSCEVPNIPPINPEQENDPEEEIDPEEENDTTFYDCVIMNQVDSFILENFKEGYTIQFPKKYGGKGLETGEFLVFKKSLPSEGIYFSYFYPLTTDGSTFFGVKLKDPIPTKYVDSYVKLETKREFCINDSIESILYHDNEKNDNYAGLLFMKHKDWYYESLKITYKNPTQMEEIINILKTIKKE